MKRTCVIMCAFFYSIPGCAQQQERADAVASPAVGVSAAGTPIRQIRPRVDALNAYERVFMIVPIVGKGTMDDPKRPLYAPTPHAVSSSARSGILAYHFEVSDNGLFALVEFVVADRSAFKALLADTTVQSFVRGQDNPAAVEAAFKLLKKDFNIKNFRLRVL